MNGEEKGPELLVSKLPLETMSHLSAEDKKNQPDGFNPKSRLVPWAAPKGAQKTDQVAQNINGAAAKSWKGVFHPSWQEHHEENKPTALQSLRQIRMRDFEFYLEAVVGDFSLNLVLREDC